MQHPLTFSNPTTRIAIEAAVLEQLHYAFMVATDGEMDWCLSQPIDTVAANSVYLAMDILLAPHRWFQWPAH